VIGTTLNWTTLVEAFKLDTFSFSRQIGDDVIFLGSGSIQ
jgi:hypothetical protein